MAALAKGPEQRLGQSHVFRESNVFFCTDGRIFRTGILWKEKNKVLMHPGKCWWQHTYCICLVL